MALVFISEGEESPGLVADPFDVGLLPLWLPQAYSNFYNRIGVGLNN